MPPKSEAVEEEKPDLGVEVEDPNVTVDLSAEDEDEGEGERTVEGGEPAGDRQRDPVTGKWSKKKNERGRENREAKNWRAEKAELESRLQRQEAEANRRFQELQQQIQQSQRQQPTGQPQDPFAAAMADIDGQLAAELQLIEKDNSRDYKRYMALQEKRSELIAERTWARKDAERQRQQPAQQQDTYAVRRQLLQGEHPWLYQPHMKDLADKAWAIRNSLITLEGRPDSIETDREALSAAVARFGGQYGLRAPAPPSTRTRNLYAAPVSGTGPNRGAPMTEIELPKALVNGAGLSPAALRAALRDVEG